MASKQLGRKYVKEHYSREEVESLIDAIKGDSATAKRNRALIATLWQSGLRINEALMMAPHDFSGDEIHVRFGKAGKKGGPKERRVRAGPVAVQYVTAWKAARNDLDLPPGAPLFCTLKGTKMHHSYVQGMLNTAAQRAGWTKRIHAHGFRHTFAVTLAKSGIPMAMLQRQLGHRYLSTTGIYLESITTEDMAEAMQKVEW